jgi:hypothetical protein
MVCLPTFPDPSRRPSLRSAHAFSAPMMTSVNGNVGVERDFRRTAGIEHRRQYVPAAPAPVVTPGADRKLTTDELEGSARGSQRDCVFVVEVAAQDLVRVDDGTQLVLERDCELLRLCPGDSPEIAQTIARCSAAPGALAKIIAVFARSKRDLAAAARNELPAAGSGRSLVAHGVRRARARGLRTGRLHRAL